MKRLAFLIFLFFFINSIFAACCLYDSCGCGKVESTTYKATDFKLTLRKFTPNVPYDKGDVLPVNSTAGYNQFAFLFSPEVSSIAAMRNFRSLPALAFACSPADNPSQEFKSIKIQSETDYPTPSGTFPAGEDLSSLFSLSRLYTGNTQSIAEFLAQHDRSVYDEVFYFQLVTAPLAKVRHQFTFTFELSDNRTIKVLSDPIEIN
jgi:hypothetical protein